MSLSEISRQDEIENLYLLSTKLYENTKDKTLDDDSFKNIISLNGGYGCGKTHFLKKFQKYVKEQGNPQIVKLNIWEDDFADDPLIPILHTIAEHDIFKEVQDKIAFLMSILKGTGFIVKTLLKFLKIDITEHIDDFIAFLTENNVNLANIQELSEASKKFKDFIKQVKAYFENKKTAQSAIHKNLKKIDPEFFIKKQVIKLIKQCLHDTVKETDKPFFILVDELDRCRPDYAVTTLERIKHIFNVAGLVFILAVDRKQLEHSVRHAFGSEWDFDNYYLRFAPIEISLGSVFDKIHGNTWGVDFMNIQPYFNDLSTIIPNFLKEIDCTLRILVMTKEKIELLGLPDNCLLPILCLTTKNSYRDAFYELFVNCNVNSPKIPAGLTKLIMFFINQNENFKDWLDNNITTDNSYINHTLMLFNISHSFEDNEKKLAIINFPDDWKRNNSNSTVEAFIKDFIVFGFKQRYFKIKSSYQSDYQPILKSLFEHYKPIENE